MRGLRHPAIGVVALSLTIGAFTLLIGYSLFRISAIERDMRMEATQNMLWVISRAQVAALELSEACVEHALGEIDQPGLEQYYNVFLSRLALLDDGPQRRRMIELGFEDALARFRGDVAEIDALIKSPGPQNAQRLRALLKPYIKVLNRAANRAMVTEWDALGDKLDSARERLWHLIAAIIGVALAGAALCTHLLMATREAKRRTRLLGKEKAFSELLIASSGEGIIAVDTNRRCTVWNEAARLLFGMSQREAIGRPLNEVAEFFQIDGIQRAIEASLGGQAATLLDQPFFQRVEDEPRYVDLRFFSLRDGMRIVGSILLVSDVTEQRAAQRQIADHRDHLEQLVHARTEELNDALKRERESAELYRNFGAMISHQFRTPLAIIDSALQRLMRRSGQMAQDELNERAGRARQAVARMTKLVESTLDAARLDAGQLEIRAQACDLVQIVNDLCTRQSQLTPERRIEIDLPEAGTFIAHCDPVHVENILTNLLSNAIKYSAPETVIGVSVTSNGNYVACHVANQGTIACRNEREAIFERYFRGSNSEGRPGIGIGLYMSRTLARMQGGDVRLSVEKPGWLTFTVSLPQAQADRHAPSSSLQPELI
ncbi:MAG: hypothetical protein CMH69_14240 [Nitratireductor sp.]|nr:hypothetical protein [Nitratireductor sp.]